MKSHIDLKSKWLKEIFQNKVPLVLNYHWHQLCSYGCVYLIFSRRCERQ